MRVPHRSGHAVGKKSETIRQTRERTRKSRTINATAQL